MSRRRMIHDSIWRSQSLAELPLEVCHLFIGLITTADDQGRRRGHPGLIRADIFPLRDISFAILEDWLGQLECAGCIMRYEAEGKALIQIVNWWQYQQPTWAWPSDLPGPDGWSDRHRYRKGNAVIESNWGQSEPTVNPQPAQCETAPNGSTNGNGSTNDSGNGDGISENELAAIVVVLEEFGMGDAETVARKTVRAGLTAEQVKDNVWRAKHATPPLGTGWLYTVCVAGKHWPRGPTTTADDRRGYLGGEFAEWVVT